MMLRTFVLIAVLVVPLAARGERIASLLVIMKEGQADQRGDACDALGEMGPAARSALPDLIAGLRDSHWQTRWVVPRVLLKIAPTDPTVLADLDAAAASDPQQDVREAIAYAFEDDQRAGKAAIPILTRLLKDKERSVVVEAAHALKTFGADAAPAAPALLEALKSEESTIRIAAAGVLGKLDAAAKPAVPSLIAMLKAGDQWERGYTALALGDLGPIAKEAIPDLIKATQDREAAVQCNAAYALGRMNQPASVLPAANAALRAAFDLGVLRSRGGGDDAAILKLLEGAKKAGDSRLRSLAADAAIDTGETAMPALVAALDSPDEEIRAAAAFALGQLARSPTVRASPHAAQAVRALVARLKDPDPSTRSMTGTALAAFKSPLALPALLEAIKAKDWDTRADAALALGGLTGDPQSSPAAASALIGALKDEHPWVRWVAVRTLKVFGPGAKDAVPRLIEMLDDRASTEISLPPPKRPLNDEQKAMLNMLKSVMKGGQVRDAVAATLGKIGPDAHAAVPVLIEELKQNDRNAIKALGDIGPDGAAAVPVLAELLKEAPYSYDAAPALAKIGGAGAVALVTALKNQEQRYIAQEALSRGGRAVVPALKRALTDPDEEVRRAAADALRAIGGAITD
jgi:HEAT repeat protein